MAFIIYPTNVDYLIEDVRFRAGDVEGTRFSDSLVRSALINGIKFLQNRWQKRYQVYNDLMLVTPQPTDGSVPSGQIYVALPDGYGLIPSGLVNNDVFRNPFETFTDPSKSVIVQTDEYPVVLAAAMFLQQTTLSANQQTFVNWSDGEYSYSNVAASKIMEGITANLMAELNAYFKVRRAAILRGDFTNFVMGYPYIGYPYYPTVR